MVHAASVLSDLDTGSVARAFAGQQHRQLIGLDDAACDDTPMIKSTAAVITLALLSTQAPRTW
jgi:hypothetical protein